MIYWYSRSNNDIIDEIYNNSIAKVTSHKMNESEMGNRVAKSNINYIEYNVSLRLYDLFVKVQRVYGSSCIVVTIIITLGFIIIQYIKTCSNLYIGR